MALCPHCQHAVPGPARRPTARTAAATCAIRRRRPCRRATGAATPTPGTAAAPAARPGCRPRADGSRPRAIAWDAAGPDRAPHRARRDDARRS